MFLFKTSVYTISFLLIGCASSYNENQQMQLSSIEKIEIKSEIKKVIDTGIKATRNKDIKLYMSVIPKDMNIRTENGELVTYEIQKENTIRDWSIIDKTLNINMTIDSLKYITSDSVIVYTSQKWERLMYRRDGITTDTILTTQNHKEIWLKRDKGWRNYYLSELGGKIFINGELYNP